MTVKRKITRTYCNISLSH